MTYSRRPGAASATSRSRSASARAPTARRCSTAPARCSSGSRAASSRRTRSRPTDIQRRAGGRAGGRRHRRRRAAPGDPVRVHTAAGEPVTIADREGAGFRLADEDLAGYVVLDFAAFDEWYEEDEPVVVPPARPLSPRRRAPDLAAGPHRDRRRRRGRDDARPAAVRDPASRRASTSRARTSGSSCIRATGRATARTRAEASYWSVDAGGRRARTSRWSYEQPLPDAPADRGPGRVLGRAGRRLPRRRAPRRARAGRSPPRCATSSASSRVYRSSHACQRPLHRQ